MDRKDQYEELGQWLTEQFQLDVIVCEITGKRWAFKWSNISDIENARRIQLSPDIGIIIPAETNKEFDAKIKGALNISWFEKKE
ncbi:hypothetical protein [Salinivirga cyanobacteriivorans]